VLKAFCLSQFSFSQSAVVETHFVLSHDSLTCTPYPWFPVGPLVSTFLLWSASFLSLNCWYNWPSEWSSVHIRCTLLHFSACPAHSIRGIHHSRVSGHWVCRWWNLSPLPRVGLCSWLLRNILSLHCGMFRKPVYLQLLLAVQNTLVRVYWPILWLCLAEQFNKDCSLRTLMLPWYCWFLFW